MSDPKLITPRRKYGTAAIVVYLQLLVMAYRDKGYYLIYNEETRDNVIWSIKSEVLSGKYEPDAEKIAEMIDCLAACRLFSHDLFQRGFITSHRIQEHYYFATAGRTDPEVRWDLWLLTEQEMRAISTRNVLLQKFISLEGNPSFTSEKPPFPHCESTHSKVKERIKKDSISTLPIEQQVESILGTMLNRSNHSQLQRMLAVGMTEEFLLYVANYAVGNAKGDRAAYFMTVLREYERDGIHTIADLDAKRKSKNQKAESGTTGHPGAESMDEEWIRRVRAYQARQQEGEV